MGETASSRNNLPLLFLHLDVAPITGVGGQVARSSRRSLDPVRLVSGGRCSALSRVAVASAIGVVFGVMQLGAWMMAGGGIPLLRLRRMKLTASVFGGPVDVPQSLCLVACNNPVHRLLASFFALPWWWRRTLVDDISARHRILQE